MHEHEGFSANLSSLEKLDKFAGLEKNRNWAAFRADWAQDYGWITMGQAQIDGEAKAGRPGGRAGEEAGLGSRSMQRDVVNARGRALVLDEAEEAVWRRRA